MVHSPPGPSPWHSPGRNTSEWAGLAPTQGFLDPEAALVFHGQAGSLLVVPPGICIIFKIPIIFSPLIGGESEHKVSFSLQASKPLRRTWKNVQSWDLHLRTLRMTFFRETKISEVSRNISRVILRHINYSYCVRPIWPINCWFQLLQVLLADKRSETKVPIQRQAPSPQLLAAGVLALPESYLIARSLDQDLSLLWLHPTSKLGNLISLFPAPRAQLGQTAPSIQLWARGRAFVSVLPMSDSPAQSCQIGAKEKPGGKYNPVLSLPPWVWNNRI